MSGSNDKTIRLWDAETGNPISNPLLRHSDCISSVAFSPDGSHILYGSYDKTIRLLDAKTGNAVSSSLEGHSGIITSVAFSPDGSYIVSSSFDSTIRLWDARILDITSTMASADYTKLLPSGWVVNAASEKLFWVSPWNRATLCLYGQKMTISRDGVSTSPDMSRFVHGTAWEQCKTG